MQERQLHRFLEHTQESFLFLFGSPERFDFVAANRAERQDFSAAAAHAMDALFAHEFMAMLALKGDVILGMAGTLH